MLPSSFEYHRPATLDEALALLAHLSAKTPRSSRAARA